MNALVSVIIPTYNREGMVCDAINSVFAQSYQNIEIIIVDDGSTDNTREVINSIQDSRIKYIYQDNAGVSAARNRGINNATGDYIALLDSDDLWYPEKIEKQIKLFNQNPEAGVCRCWTKYITFSGEEIRTLTCRLPSKENLIRNFLLNPDTIYFGTLSFLVKKKCFDNVGYYNEKMSYAEDWDMLFRLALYYEFINVDEILASVRVNAGSVSRAIDVSKLEEDFIRFLDHSFSNPLLPKNVLTVKDKAYGNMYCNIAYQALYKAKNYMISRNCLMKSFKYSPDKIFYPRFLIAVILSFSPNCLMRIYEGIRNFYRGLAGRNFEIR